MSDKDAVIADLEIQLQRVTQALFASETRYDHLVRGTQGLICRHDLNGVLLAVNPAACRILGYEEDEMVGHNLREFLPKQVADIFDGFLERMKADRSASGRLLILAKDGRLVTFQYHNVLIDEESEPYVLGHAYDLTEILDLQRQLEELTVTDDLTGLFNRRGFLARANDRVSLAARSSEALALIFADVDGLKRINDQHGHETGSHLIIDAAGVLKDSLRQTDILSRWGGDEFVIILGRASDEGLDAVLTRIQRKIDAYNSSSGQPYTLSISLGVVPIAASEGIDLQKLIAQADEEMYEAKRERKK